MMSRIPEALILLAVAGLLLQLWCGTGVLRGAVRPAGLLMLLLAAGLHWFRGFNLSIPSAATLPSAAAAFDDVLRRHAVWIACGFGAPLLLMDSARQPRGTGLVLLAVAGLGATAAADSAIWVIAGLYVVALASGLLIRTGDTKDDPASHDRERLVLQAVCLVLFLFGVSLLTAAMGTLSLSEMRSQIGIDAEGASVARSGGGGAVAASVLMTAGLSGVVCSLRLPWGANRSGAGGRIGPVAAAALLPATTAVLILFRLFPGLLSAWHAEVMTVVTTGALLLTGVGLLGIWLETGLRETLGWACVVHAGLWCISLTVAGWDANHPDWSLVAESGLPGGYSATLILLLCDVAAMLGVWATLSLLAGERGAMQHPDDLCGLLRQYPLAGTTLSVCLLSLCGAPFLAGFWGRFWSLAAMFGPRQASSLTGLYEPHEGFLVLVALAAAAQLLLCGPYLRLLQRIVLEHPLGRIRPEGSTSALVSVTVLAGIILFVGLGPVPLMRAVTPGETAIPALPSEPVPSDRGDEEPSTPGGGGGQQAALLNQNLPQLYSSVMRC